MWNTGSSVWMSEGAGAMIAGLTGTAGGVFVWFIVSLSSCSLRLTVYVGI